jgi:hypothetical protein
MSYLVEYAVRRPAPAGRRRRGIRVDERIVLNRPKFDGGAHVRVYVEDTSARRVRFRRSPPAPHLRLRIADCVNEIALEFSVSSPELRENSLHKSPFPLPERPGGGGRAVHGARASLRTLRAEAGRVIPCDGQIRPATTRPQQHTRKGGVRCPTSSACARGGRPSRRR